MIELTSRRIVALLCGLGLVAGLLATPASSAAAGSADQCVVKVVGQQADGTFVTGDEQCFSSYADVLASLGDRSQAASVRPQDMTSNALLADSILATHYDGHSLTGASFSVSGTTCGGGGLNLPLSWNDRISSTANGCNDIIHYHDTNYAGIYQVTTGAGGEPTGSMDNATSSIKYYA